MNSTIVSMASKPAATLTCIACNQVFEDLDELKVHYSSEWHRNNLLLKAENYKPRTLEEFETAMLRVRPAPKVKPASVHCDVCQKVFKTPNAYDNHLSSKKHKDNMKKMPDGPPQNNEGFGNGEAAPEADNEEVDDDIKEVDDDIEEVDDDIEEVDSDEWDEEDNPVNNNDCIFCLHHSKNFKNNFKHMSIFHSFFIPDPEYCIDIEGLMKYLGQKVSESFICLWCNEKGKSFHSAQAARNHMISKGHCKMIYEGVALAEYSAFYDYSSSYPDMDVEDGMEVDEGEEAEEAASSELGGSEYQLVLPSGITIGHRSLMKYYKQSIDPSRSQALVASNNSKKLHKVLAHYKSIGWTQTQQEEAARRAKDIHYMKRKMSKLNLGLGMRGNKVHMKHFRSQNP